MAEERKIRVTIYLNGEEAGVGGKLLVISPNTTWDELLTKAATKLGAVKPLKRVFVANGAEATDVEEILNGDELYFSYGEDFFGEDSIVYLDDDATSEQKIERRKFLTNMANSVAGMASAVYDSSSKYVKEKSPTFVKVTIERVEDKVGTFATPIISKVVEVGTWADEKLDNAYHSFSKVGTEFLESPLAKTVNEKLVIPFKQKVVDPSTAFYKNLNENFQQLLAKSKEQGKSFSADDFIATLKVKLGRAWNDNLIEPAKVFYKAAMDAVAKNETISTVKQNLDHVWKETVVQNFKTHIQVPAETFYQTALQSYLALSKTGDGKVTFEEFSAALRVKFGNLWNEHLATPAKYLFEKFNLEAPQPFGAPEPKPQEQALP